MTADFSNTVIVCGLSDYQMCY